MMQLLEDSRAKPTDRLFMLTELACLKDPAIRRQALETALKSSERALRIKALTEILMQRAGVRAQLTPIRWRPGYTVHWVEKGGWAVDFNFHARSREHNCINLTRGREPCYARAMLVVDGLKVRITDAGRSLTGEFVLEPGGLLTGQINLRGNAPAKARIDLL